MAVQISLLDRIQIAAPCSADWEGMAGDERVRHCGQCRLNVYNISEMRREEAERLITTTEGRLCVRLYRRRDGTVITNNCPVGLRAIRRHLERLVSGVAAVLGVSILSSPGCIQGGIRCPPTTRPAHNQQTAQTGTPMPTATTRPAFGSNNSTRPAAEAVLPTPVITP